MYRNSGIFGKCGRIQFYSAPNLAGEIKLQPDTITGGPFANKRRHSAAQIQNQSCNLVYVHYKQQSFG